jgi:hypothetical protein
MNTMGLPEASSEVFFQKRAVNTKDTKSTKVLNPVYLVDSDICIAF